MILTEKEKLLKEIKALEANLPKRKERSDKGCKRKSYNRSSPTNATHQDKSLSTYNRIKSRLNNRYAQQIANEGQSLLSNSFDYNGFYLSIPATYKTVQKPYVQVLADGRSIQHTLARIKTQGNIDLEKYRFEYMRGLASNPATARDIATPTADLRQIICSRTGLTPSQAHEAILNRNITNRIMFGEIYFVKPEDVDQWSYEKWREWYDEIPPQQLDEDFVLDPAQKPDYEWYRERKERESEEEKKKEKERRMAQWNAHWRTK